MTEYWLCRRCRGRRFVPVETIEKPVADGKGRFIGGIFLSEKCSACSGRGIIGVVVGQETALARG